MKKVFSVLLIVLLLGGCATNEAKFEESSGEDVSKYEICFTDDSGKEIVLDKPAETIISLYSVHTENLYSLGLDEEIIGVGTSDKYPEDVLNKTRYSFKDDPELVIAANPDVVLVRTMILNRFPDYFKAIEDAGITVINLYPNEFEEFDNYIERLGKIVGKDEEAKELLSEFDSEIEKIKENTKKISMKKTAYFESIGEKFKTATPDSFAGTALKLIGLENIVENIETEGTSTVITYGEEKLLSKGKEIDVYIGQKGTMNKTVSVDKIKERPGYNIIKAIQEDNIFIIDEKLISSATLRYLEGLKELQNEIYGDELIEEIKGEKN